MGLHINIEKISKMLILAFEATVLPKWTFFLWFISLCTWGKNTQKLGFVFSMKKNPEILFKFAPSFNRRIFNKPLQNSKFEKSKFETPKFEFSVSTESITKYISRPHQRPLWEDFAENGQVLNRLELRPMAVITYFRLMYGQKLLLRPKKEN